MVCRVNRGNLDESESELLSLPMELRRTKKNGIPPNEGGPHANRDWAPVLLKDIPENTIRDLVPKGIV